jgi:hypothetical protein
MIQALDDMESVAKLFGIPPFDIYFMGGAACVLGGYTDRVTQDFDFLDLGYGSHMGRVFSILRDYDMLEYESTVIAPDYEQRATKIGDYMSFNAYIMSPEDIVVSKIIRLEPKDIQDIDELIAICDKSLINAIIDGVLGRADLFESKKTAFVEGLKPFRERYDV